MVEHGTDVPPSWQLADLLRRDIESGKLPTGSRLPSITSLASEHGVATNTVQKALGILKRDGLVKSIPGYGTFVT